MSIMKRTPRLASACLWTTIFLLSSCAGSGSRPLPPSDGSVDGAGDAAATSCGDKLVADSEECDDGNLLDGDGCSSGCTIEKGWSCSGEPSVCSNLCGTGTKDPGEECDGSDVGGQTCASIDQGFDSGILKCSASCRFDTTGCTSPGCGNGTKDPGEECDDGNQSNQDGCLTNCRKAVCGDGYTYQGQEECDDGNQSNRDGCLTDCRTAFCGDGFIETGVEDCDDSNTSNADGCSSSCSVESGWDCQGMPSQCTRLCGNGHVDPGEDCDDGNAVAGDGCAPDCTDEHLPVMYWATGNPAVWGHMTITYADDVDAPQQPIVAAANADQRGYAYVFTATTYHLLSLPDNQWVGHGLLSSRFPGVPGSLVHGALGVSWGTDSQTTIVLVVPSRTQAYFYREDNITGAVTADATNPYPVDWSQDPNSPSSPSVMSSVFQTLSNANGWTQHDLHALCGDDAPAGTDVGPYMGILTTSGVLYLYNAGYCWLFYDHMPIAQFSPFTATGAPPTSNIIALFYSTKYGDRLYVIVQP